MFLDLLRDEAALLTDDTRCGQGARRAGFEIQTDIAIEPPFVPLFVEFTARCVKVEFSNTHDGGDNLLQSIYMCMCHS